VLKLIYHTATLGPIDLEYERPVIRVGRSEDNDLVLRHPSIAPRHCVLVFRGERVLCLAPDQEVSAETDLWSLAGPELGAGDPIVIGDLQFTLAHSPKTVELPEVHAHAAMPSTSAEDVDIGAPGPSAPRHYCPNCRAFIPASQVKRVGLVGHAKRDLCPKCSRLLETRPSVASPV
jgi:hypothetical protein